MGMFKDMNKMKKQGNEMLKAQGKRTGMIGMMRDMPGNISRASSAVDDAMAMQANLQKSQALLQTGTQGRATVQGVQQTGTLINFNPQVILDLQVTVPGQAPYAAKLTEAVPQVYLARLQPGADIGVRIDPTDPQTLALDWAAA
jgi:hypothetical protein